eukprot:m.241311 g.241311  ORF g.241311 m.241311 type:complete len:752 (+) comp15323_c0_seq1:878-3133(+)
MNTALLVVAALACAIPSCRGGPTRSYRQYVDPFIGTGGFGFGVGGDPPGPQVPFGCLRLSPDGSEGDVWLDFLHYGGYSDSDTHIRCFSHTHMVGSGASDYGNIGVMAVREIPSVLALDGRYWYKSAFSHDKEIAEPGYYSVHLDDADVDVELTACGTHAGIHRYHFANSTSKRGNYILFDLAHSTTKGEAVVNGSIDISSSAGSTTVTGRALNHGALTGRNGVGVNVYFAAQFNATATLHGVWNQSGVVWNQDHLDATFVGGLFKFDEDVVDMNIGISFVSVAQAQANLNQQIAGSTFAKCRQATENEWDAKLSLVQVNDDNASKDDLTIFYTALYHAHLAPTTWTEANGVYLGMDNKVHTAPKGVVRFTDMSIWDIHRTQVPLLISLEPDVALNIAHTLVGMFNEGGDLPRWPIANVYAGCMIATHANVMLAEMIAKNVTDFDIETAYHGMYLQATNATRPHIGRSDLEDYLRLGYVPTDKESKAASLTLAYAYDDGVLSTVASFLNKHEDAAMFANRSKSYRNVWDPSSSYFCPRFTNGTFRCNLDPTFHGWMFDDDGFCEGNQAEWRWFVPHDLDGLVELMGKPTYIKELTNFFENTRKDNWTTLPNPYYWAGNEPDILEPFQFNVVGRADLSRKYSREVMKQSYSTQPNGIPGNDDYGTLSAWYVWAALGIFPRAGSDTYYLGAPLFANVTVNFSGHPLTILGNGASPDNWNVSSISLDGATIDTTTATVKHAQLARSSTLTFTMN